MPIDVSHVNPTFVTALSLTITTNTIYDANRPRDRNYVFADDIVAIVNADAVVGGQGLALVTTLPSGGDISMTNNGSILVDAGNNALQLIGNGGAVTYAGTGTITNFTQDGLVITNTGNGSADVTISNDINSVDVAVDVTTQNGPIAFTLDAGAIVSTPLDSGNDVVFLGSVTRDIVGNVHGTIRGARDALIAESNVGDVIVNFTGTIASAFADGIVADTGGSIIVNSSGNFNTEDICIAATTDGNEPITINMTGGQFHSEIDDGIQAFADGGGDILINMTGGQMGTASERMGSNGIQVDSLAGGDVDVTSMAIFSEDRGIDIVMGGGAGSINLIINGTIDSLNDNGVNTTNEGSGSTTITVNSAVTGAIGVRDLFGDATVLNFATITGTGGVAVNLGPGNDIYDGRGGTVVGAVLGGEGNDLFLSGAGDETFNGILDVDTVDYLGTTGPLIVSLRDGTATGHGNDTLISIQNARGGSFGDTFIGAPGANTFRGRGGDDTFVIAPGGNSDIIEDFLAGAANPADRVDVRAFANISSLDDLLALATQVGPNTVIDFGGGDTLTLNNVATADLVDGDLILVAQLGDVLWRHDDGQVRTFDHDLGNVSTAFEVAGTGDFDGDGGSDILWRHTDGLTVSWELQDGELDTVHNYGIVSTNFEIAETGDFDGDGDDGILWRGEDGQVVIWEMQDGELVTNHNQPTVPTNFEIAGTGDFDDDGDDDILWRGEDGQVVIWEMQDAAFVTNHNQPAVPTNFQIAGTGDFDGDGDADILWRHTDGTTVTWQMEGGGLLATHDFGVVATAFQIQGTEDFDRDGDSDVLWRHTDGTVVTWVMEDGALQATPSFGVTQNTWQITGTGGFDLA